MKWRGGSCELASVDFFVSTVDPLKEPPLVTANTVLSILAVDYPVEKVSCYVSDDGASMLTFETMAETAEFARKWVPFCNKYLIEPRAPEFYFSQKFDYLKDKVQPSFVKERRAMKVIAFSDEGVRFQTTFLGSAVKAGSLPASALTITDKSGVSVQDALWANSIEATEENFAKVKYDPESVFAYVEVHIEQGPVLDSLAYPLGVVKGIAGQTRLKVAVEGSQGHAGTVPMFMRRDPMVAASELIVLLESLCKHPQNFLP